MTVSALVISVCWMVFTNVMNDSFGKIFERTEHSPWPTTSFAYARRLAGLTTFFAYELQ